MSSELDLLRRAWRARCDAPAKRRDDALRVELERTRHDVAEAERVVLKCVEGRRPIVMTSGLFAHHALEQLAATDAQVALALTHKTDCDCSACDYVGTIIERLVAEAERAIAEGTLP